MAPDNELFEARGPRLTPEPCHAHLHLFPWAAVQGAGPHSSFPPPPSGWPRREQAAPATPPLQPREWPRRCPPAAGLAAFAGGRWAPAVRQFRPAVRRMISCHAHPVGTKAVLVALPCGRWKLSLNKETRAGKWSVVGAGPNPASGPAVRGWRPFPRSGTPALGSRAPDAASVPPAPPRGVRPGVGSAAWWSLSLSPAPESARVCGEHPPRGLPPLPGQSPHRAPGSASVSPRVLCEPIVHRGRDSQLLSGVGSAQGGPCFVLGQDRPAWEAGDAAPRATTCPRPPRAASGDHRASRGHRKSPAAL